MHYGWSSPFLPLLTNGNYTFTITSTESSWLAVCPLIGALFGAFFAGFACDIVGRRKLILLSSIPFFVSWLMIAFANSVILFYISRLVAGFTDGLSFTAVPMYLSEIAEPKIRGFLASILPVSIVVGLLLINILGNYLPMDTTAIIASILPILLLITYYFMPESPYFFLIKDRVEEAKESLQTLRGVDDVGDELNRLVTAVKEQNENRGRYSDLFTVKSNRKAISVALILRGIQQLSGVTAFIFYCKTIFQEANDFLSPNVGTILYFTVQLIFSIIASIVVDFSGRRPLLLISTIGTALTLLLNGTYLYIKNCTDLDISDLNFLPIVAMLLFIIIFSMGLTTVPLLIIGELFPTNVKGLALSAIDIFYSIMATIVSQYFHWTNSMFGIHVPFYTFSVCCFIAVFYIYIFVPETKGKTLEDIQRELRGEELVDQIVK